MPNRRLFRSLALVFVISGTASAVSLSGSSTTSLLLTDRHTTTRDAVSRMPAYEHVSFLLGSMANDRLSFVGSARAWRDMQSNAADESDLRVYRAFARWRDFRSGLELRAGRQRVREGVGRTYLDGIYAKKRRGRFAVAGFVGQPLRNDLDGSERWDKSAYQWGTQANWLTSARLRLALSYTEMRYDSRTGLRLVGGAATYTMSETQTIRLRADYDAERQTVDRATFLWMLQPERNTVYSVEAYYRQARLWAFSQLRSISDGGYFRGTASVVRPLRDDVRLYAAVSGLNAGGGAGVTADLGIFMRALKIGYLFSTTKSVTGNGVYVQGSYRLNEKLRVGGRTNWSRYETDAADDAAQTIGTALFATISPLNNLDITCEGHHVTDDFYTYQFEGLVSVHYRFERVSGR